MSILATHHRIIKLAPTKKIYYYFIENLTKKYLMIIFIDILIDHLEGEKCVFLQEKVTKLFKHFSNNLFFAFQ